MLVPSFRVAVLILRKDDHWNAIASGFLTGGVAASVRAYSFWLCTYTAVAAFRRCCVFARLANLRLEYVGAGCPRWSGLQQDAVECDSKYLRSMTDARCRPFSFFQIDSLLSYPSRTAASDLFCVGERAFRGWWGRCACAVCACSSADVAQIVRI